MFSRLASVLALAALSFAAPASNSSIAALPTPGSLQQISNFGANPNNVGIYAYVPNGVVANPGLLVALHYCTGTAQAYFSGTQYRNLADSKKSYVVIYGNAPRSGGCWDVASTATLTHDGGGDSLGIANAVRYAIENWGVDASKVFVAGTSSGAMMSNVLAGAYPDLFKGIASVSGVPFGCFAGPSDWNNQCSQGQLTKTAQQWGDQVRAAYSGYSGQYPRIQLWHGTADTTLSYNNFNEAIKEWTNVWGFPETPASTQQNTPQSGYTYTTYGDGSVVAYSAQGVGHTVPEHETMVLDFFGL